jgi:hypothetical protein
MNFKIQIEDGINEDTKVNLSDPETLFISQKSIDGMMEVKLTRNEWQRMRAKIDAMFEFVDKKASLFSSK